MNEELFVSRIQLKEVPIEHSYPGCLPVVKNLARMKRLEFHRPVSFFVGENGIGKSTLIEAIAVALGFNPEGGTLNFNFSTCNSHSELYRYLSVCRTVKRRRDGFFLRAESFYNVASYVDELDRIPAAAPPIIDSYGGVSLHRQSHGESFLALAEKRFGGNGIYILDEPEAALSPSRLMRLMVRMNELVKQGSQFIISTHSPILMAFPNAEIYELTQDAIRSVAYYETEHFQITKRFVNHPEQMLRYLLSNESEENHEDL